MSLKRLRVAQALLCSLLLAPVLAAATVVRFATDRGPIDIVLLDTEAPKTVANFLAYVRRNAYDNSFFHRVVPNFVIQGGGFIATPNVAAVTTDPAVENEFSATRSNVRGTVAMAKLGSNPNSATSQWFVNLADNAANLDNQNGGFTVFGRVTAPSMAIVDTTAQLTRVNAGGCGTAYTALTDLPVTNIITSCAQVVAANLALVNTARELQTTTASDSDRIFNYLEAAYPQYAAPSSPASQFIAEGYYYRYYAKTNAYVGSKDGNLYYLVPAISNQITLLGTVAEWLAIATAAGY